MFDLDGLILENPSGKRKKKIKAQKGLNIASEKQQSNMPQQGVNPIQDMMQSQFYNNPQPTAETPMGNTAPTTPPAMAQEMYNSNKKESSYYMGRVPSKELDVTNYGSDPMAVMNELQTKVNANPYDRTSVRQLQNFIAQNAKGDKEILDILDTTSSYKGKAGTTYDGVYGKGTKTAYNMLMQKMQSSKPTYTESDMGENIITTERPDTVYESMGDYDVRNLKLENQVKAIEGAERNNAFVTYKPEDMETMRKKYGIEPFLVTEEAYTKWMNKDDDKYKQQDLDLQVELIERASRNNKPVVYNEKQFEEAKKKFGVEPLMVSESAFDAYMKKRTGR